MVPETQSLLRRVGMRQADQLHFCVAVVGQADFAHVGMGDYHRDQEPGLIQQTGSEGVCREEHQGAAVRSPDVQG